MTCCAGLLFNKWFQSCCEGFCGAVKTFHKLVTSFNALIDVGICHLATHRIHVVKRLDQRGNALLRLFVVLLNKFIFEFFRMPVKCICGFLRIFVAIGVVRCGDVRQVLLHLHSLQLHIRSKQGQRHAFIGRCVGKSVGLAQVVSHDQGAEQHQEKNGTKAQPKPGRYFQLHDTPPQKHEVKWSQQVRTKSVSLNQIDGLIWLRIMAVPAPAVNLSVVSLLQACSKRMDRTSECFGLNYPNAPCGLCPYTAA